MVAGAVILEALARHLRLRSVTTVSEGLRDGLLIDLARQRREPRRNPSTVDEAVVLGRRFDFDEPHARKVCELVLVLFDALERVHGLSPSARPLLETAALLHDIGHSVSYQRHHKHTYYLIKNADLPGLSDIERDLVARIARYHRRSPPESWHPDLADLEPAKARLVSRLATLLRIADALDRSHHQPVHGLRVRIAAKRVSVQVRARAAVDLELWDAGREQQWFHQVFGRTLELKAGRGRC